MNLVPPPPHATESQEPHLQPHSAQPTASKNNPVASSQQSSTSSATHSHPPKFNTPPASTSCSASRPTPQLSPASLADSKPYLTTQCFGSKEAVRRAGLRTDIPLSSVACRVAVRWGREPVVRTDEELAAALD